GGEHAPWVGILMSSGVASLHGDLRPPQNLLPTLNRVMKSANAASPDCPAKFRSRLRYTATGALKEANQRFRVKTNPGSMDTAKPGRRLPPLPPMRSVDGEPSRRPPKVKVSPYFGRKVWPNPARNR